MNRKLEIIEQIERHIDASRFLIEDADNLIKIADVLADVFTKGNKLIIFGNGGSAADAQHIAAELGGKFHKERDPLPAIAITTNTSMVTAIANDFGYEEIFSRQVRGISVKGDVVIGISTSGNSINVINAIEAAKKVGCTTVVFTGASGKLKSIADYVISVPSADTPRIQEVHITAGHIICYLVEEALFGSKKK